MSEQTPNEIRAGITYRSIRKVFLECITDSHYKFYMLSRKTPDDTKWLAQWGRIGNKPQSKWYEDRGNENTMLKLYDAKIKKGYIVKKFEVFGNSASQAKSEALEYARSMGLEIEDLDDILL